MSLGVCMDLVIGGPTEALGVFVVLAFAFVVAWHVERAIRRRARDKRDREWYKRPPKKLLR